MSRTYQAKPDNYADYQCGLQGSWLSAKWGEAWGAAWGLHCDVLTDGVVAAVKTHLLTECPDDALPYHAWERPLVKGPSETNDQFRDRLTRIWEIAEFGGTEYGILLNLIALGLEVAVVVDRDWVHDDNVPGAVWARAWVIITNPPYDAFESYTDVAAAYPTYEAWGAACGGYGLTATSAEIATVRKVVEQWTDPAKLIVNVLVIKRGRVYGYPPATDYTDPTVTYDAYVAYWDGV